MTKFPAACDVAVVGGGCAGVAAAIAAARNGARTLLIERDPFVGGDLVSELPVLGCCNSRGERIVGGVLDELLQRCRDLQGYEGCIFDWCTLRGSAWTLRCSGRSSRRRWAGASSRSTARAWRRGSGCGRLAASSASTC